MIKRRQLGFTILEVLIASMVFTVVLMICVQVVTRIGQLYFKGVTSSQIQDLTRKLSEEFSGQIQ
ncbi:MAG: prepilin-type N-terminal cleavage/methylation domain-containing protein, partial [Patescibacteria group bacterium]